ncbi:MAG: hypothetical protein ACD_36C00183G0001, partial [uncultured bacterium]
MRTGQHQFNSGGFLLAEGTFKKIAFALAAGQDRIVKVREAT